MNKYSLIPESEMFRIKAEKDFTCQGRRVKKGDLGGLVWSKHNLSQEGDCWIFDEALVHDESFVCGNAMVSDYALLKGEAIIKDQVIVKDYAILQDEVTFTGNVVISGKVNVSMQNGALAIS